MMTRTIACLVASFCLAQVLTFGAEEAPVFSTFQKLPIKELTVFKDGHAFVAHEGELPTDNNGNVVLDYLPSPVLGTFWPYVADNNVRLTSVVAGQKRVQVKRTALQLRELLEANIGSEVIISEFGTNRYEAIISALPARSVAELTTSNPPNGGELLPEKGNLIALKIADGTKIIPIERIQDITFKQAYKQMAASEELRNTLTLKLDWKGRTVKSAKVGLFYLQKGVRWIPHYRIDVDGKGQAQVKLQGTLLNELADFEDVALNLVVGVPSFAFKDILDPISAQQNVARLSQYFNFDNNARNSALASNFGNAIMAQVIQSPEARRVGGMTDSAGLGPELGDAEKSEDFFVFHVAHVTLKKGERMVLPIAEFTLPYRDVFTLELPFAPPQEVRSNLNNEQQRELARLFNSPRVFHKIRLTNTSRYPLTTASALILRGGTLLAQSLMSYTSINGVIDLSITTAVDFQVKKTELETKRISNAVQENGNSYLRVNLSGKITIQNHRSENTDLEVTRYVLGHADRAERDGKIEKLNVFEDGDFAHTDFPPWWNWYGWPNWWHSFNGIGRITWKLSLPPKQDVQLAYDWHYFWR